jgi:2-methylcitrate dehydratase PrpD
MHLTETLAGFVTRARYEDIPGPARRKAAECVLDCVGVAIAGSADPIREPIRRYLDEIGGHPHATVIGLGARTSTESAAFANGVFGHVLDYDDTNQIFIGHASAVVVPAMLALGERLGCPGRDLITAYMVGTEVQWRLGEALVTSGDHYAKGWHSTGTVGTFGATAAAGKLMGLDTSRMTHAFGLAASEAGGFQEQFGTHAKSFHAGRANENGVRAALLARDGFTSARSALDGSLGYLRLVADQYDASKIAGFAQPWGILEPTFVRGINLKKYPVCASGLGAIDGMLALVLEHDIDPADVETIECAVRPKSLDILMHHDPKTGLEAKFSLEYWVAAALLDREFGLRQTTDAHVLRPAVRELIRKVRLTKDPTITFPASRVKLTVTLTDGRELRTVAYPPKGAPDNPMSEAELVAKFRDCAAWGGLAPDRTERAIAMLLGLEDLKDVAALMDCLVVAERHD